MQRDVVKAALCVVVAAEAAVMGEGAVHLVMTARPIEIGGSKAAPEPAVAAFEVGELHARVLASSARNGRTAASRLDAAA